MDHTCPNTGSRKHAVFAGPILFRLPVAAEGRFERYSSIQAPEHASSPPPMNALQLSSVQRFSDGAADRSVERWAEHVSL